MITGFPTPLDWPALRAPDCRWAPLIFECDTIAATVKRIGPSVSLLSVPIAPQSIDPARGIVWSFARDGNLVHCPAITGHAIAPLVVAGEGRNFHDLIMPHVFAAQFVIVPVIAGWDQSFDVWDQVTAHLEAGKHIIFLKGSF